MLTKQAFLDLLGDETRIIKHLYEKIPAGQLDYRPAENMRSTLELLRYLAHCGLAPAHATVNSDWKGTKQFADRCADMKADEFPDRMDQQLEEITKLIAPFSDSDMLEREGDDWAGEKKPLGYLLVMTTLRFMSAYRMQLFSHCKASGNAAMGTYNAWGGVDAPAS